MPKLESLVKNKFLNHVYKNIKYLTYISLFSLSSFMFDGCKKDSPTQPVQPRKNKPPTTAIIRPTNNQVFNSLPITLQWSGKDEDGFIKGYEVYLNGGYNYRTQTTLTTNFGLGNYSLRVVAIDNEDAKDLNPPSVNFSYTLPEVIGPVDNTNSSGYAKIELGTNVFDVYVKNLSNQSLSNIKVSGFTYENGVYGFLAEDPSRNYLSEVVHYPVNLGKRENNANPNVPIFQRAKQNNKKRIEKIYNYRRNRGVLKYIGTTPLTDLHQFYKEHDAIFNSMSFLEFATKIIPSGTVAGDAFTFALEAAKFREDIINNAANVGDIINTVTSYFGQGYDTDAYYFDVYVHKDFGIVTHMENEEKLCTLKGYVRDANSQPIANARVSVSLFYDDADQSGYYVIKSYKDTTRNIEQLLKQGIYTITASATNYTLESKSINLVAPTPPYYTSTNQNFQLSGGQPPQQTITLQPGPEGKDAYVAIMRHPQNPCFFYCNDNNGNNPNLTVLAYVQQNQTEHLYRSFLQPDLNQIPNNATVNSAILYVYGNPTASHNSTSSVNIKCKEALQPWSESSVTWNNQPSLGGSLESKTIRYNGNPYDNSDSYWESWNITSLVQQWVKGQKPNYGVSLTTDDSPRLYPTEFFMNSSDHSNSSLRPKLVITYTR